MKKKIMAVVLCTSMLFPTVCVNAETSESDIKSAIEKAIEGKLIRTVRFTESDHTVLIFILWL